MRMIDADALIAFYEDVQKTTDVEYPKIPIGVIIANINDAPTIEPSGDLISREDAKREISEWATILTKPTMLDKDATMVVLDTLPSDDKHQSRVESSDLISRADAIEAVRKEYEDAINIGDNGDAIACDVARILSELPSADAVSMEEHVKELNDLASAWKNKFINAEKRTEEIYDETMAKVANECKGCKERLRNLRPSAETKGDLISRELAMERIANDNVVGGMERINEYNNSTEFNEYLDGISDAITTIFCDVPSANITETETCQRCQESIDNDWLEDSDWARGMAEKEGIIAWMQLPKPYKGGEDE